MRPPCLSPSRLFDTAVVRLSAVAVVRHGRGTQGRAYLAPGGDISASPVPISLVTFLLGDKKVTCCYVVR